MSKMVCVVEKGFDYSKYGFKEDKKEYSLYIGIKRLYFNKNNYIMHFNMVTIEVLYVLYQMIKDDVIKFESYDKVKNEFKRKCLYLSDEEYKVIKEMRNKK